MPTDKPKSASKPKAPAKPVVTAAAPVVADVSAKSVAAKREDLGRAVLVGFWPSGAEVAHDGDRRVEKVEVDTSPPGWCSGHVVDGPPKPGCRFSFESKKPPT